MFKPEDCRDSHPLCPVWPASGFIEHEAYPEEKICPTCTSINKREAELAWAQRKEKEKS
jgi:hypothetical protein